MIIEKWTKKNNNGTTETAFIRYDGIEYTVCGDSPSLFNIYQTYTWARKSIEKYGFELKDTRIILGA